MKYISIFWYNWRIKLNWNNFSKNLVFIQLTEYQLQIYKILVKLTSDLSVDVSSIACKILGEVILSTRLWIDIPIFSFLLSISREEMNLTFVNLAKLSLDSMQHSLTSSKVPVSFFFSLFLPFLTFSLVNYLILIFIILQLDSNTVNLDFWKYYSSINSFLIF